nr:BC026374 protein (S09 family) [Hymenolepis microstoma]
MLAGFVMLRPWRCFAYFGLILSECFSTSLALQAVYVKTTDGTLRGFASTVLEKPIITFLGVPFATPPVADLRFRPPLPSKPWKGIRDATKPAPTCVQPLPEKWQQNDSMTRVWLNTTEMSEDCLYLNIWTNAIDGTRNQMDEDIWTSRKRRSKNAMPNFQKLNGCPVMVWIHGGNFVSGSASLEIYNGETLASEHGVIVVSIQYRLGPLGFLALGTPGAPGNQGLLDQVEALQWIRRNIIYFGGNPKQITLFGHGAGAISASLHLFSPISSSLFQQAILQSGSPLVWWAVDGAQSAINKAHHFARLSGCHGNDEEIEGCLRSVEVGSFSLNQWKMHLLPDMQSTARKQRLGHSYSSEALETAALYFNITFRPIVVEPFLPRWPHQILESNKDELRHRILLGVNKDEGTYEMIYGLRKYFLDKGNTPKLPEAFSSNSTGPSPLDILALNIIDEDVLFPILLHATAFEYDIPSRLSPEKEWTALEVQQALVEITGDYNIICPVIKFADAYSQAPNSQVFLYSFEHHSSGWTWPNWTGVMQGYEAEYVFGAPLNFKFQSDFYKFSEEERLFSNQIMQFWANFAATGSPSLRPDEFNTHSKNLNWNNYEVRRTIMKGDKEFDISREYIVLKSPTSRIEHNLKRRRCLFWHEQLPMMRQKMTRRCQTSPPKEQKQTERLNTQPLPASQTATWQMQTFTPLTSASATSKLSLIRLTCNIIATVIASVEMFY